MTLAPTWAVIMIVHGPATSWRERYQRAVDYLQAHGVDYEIVLVDTNGEDRQALLDLHHAEPARTTLVHVDRALGERLAIAQGAHYARGNHLVLLGISEQENGLEASLERQLALPAAAHLIDAAHKRRPQLPLDQIRVKVPALQGGAPVFGSFLPFGAPNLGPEELAEVQDTLQSGWIGFGPKTQQFEREFAAYVGSQYAISVNSATAALQLSLMALGIGPGHEVITTPLTFAATANVICHVGATPVFADIDPVTFNLDPEKVRAAITPRTRAILPVHYGGLPCDMAALDAIADEHDLVIVEDAAHAIGALYQGKKIGALGHLTCFSFYANKNLTTAEGGMMTTDDPALAEWATVNRLHGLSADAWKRYGTTEIIPAKVKYPGYKYNMTDIQASLGIHQLRKIEAHLRQREVYAEQLDELLGGDPAITLQPRPTDIDQNRHGLHLYLVKLDQASLSLNRNEFVRALRAENIGAGIHYEPLHLHPYYSDLLGLGTGSYPVAEEVGNGVISVPLVPQMTSEEVAAIAYTIRRLIDYYRD